MTPEYLEELANIADPDKLWMNSPFARQAMTEAQRQQWDTGVALRRHASHIRNLDNLRRMKKSLLITPLSANGTAVKSVKTPPEHARLRRDQT